MSHDPDQHLAIGLGDGIADMTKDPFWSEVRKHADPGTIANLIEDPARDLWRLRVTVGGTRHDLSATSKDRLVEDLRAIARAGEVHG